MKMQVKCKSCNTYFNFKRNATDRFVLARKYGENLELSCKNCGSNNQYKMNEIKAVTSKALAFLAAIILLAGTPLIIYFLLYPMSTLNNVYAMGALAGLTMFPYLIYEAIKSHDKQRVRYFNAKYYG